MATLRIDRPCVLVDTEGVAAMIGVRRESVASYLARGYLPDPLGRIAAGPVWDQDTIEAWVVGRPGRGAGGGRKPAHA